MDTQVAIRRIRIAVSVLFGVLAVALCALWVRSYWQRSVVPVLTTQLHRYELVSAEGMLIYLTQERIFYNIEFTRADPYSFIVESIKRTNLGIGRYEDGHDWAIGVVYWLLVLSTLAAGALPWIQWRFGLRTMLIATTLLAVLLGLVGYAMR